MKLSELGLIICYSWLFCVIHGPSNGQASAENVLEHNSESIPIEDTPQFHNQNHERSHLLAHLADRMDLDGEGLRHIQKHLSEVTGESEQNQDVKDVAAGDNAKGIFYFFKLHDYDDNQKLDGLEWMKALTDFHQEDNDKGEYKEGGRVFLEHEAEAIVDELLTKHDMNDDGMIDFLELMNSRVESFMTDLDKPVPGEVSDGSEQQQQQNVEEQSSLEQEFKQRQQGQQPSEHDQPQHENEPQDNRQQQDQQEEHNQQEPNSEEPQGDQEQQDNQQQHEPSLDDEYNQQQQQHQQEDQRQEQNQQEHNPEETQGDQEQQDNQQQHEPSLDDEYNKQRQEHQQHQQEDQRQEQNQQDYNPEETQGDQEQQDNQHQSEPSLEDEYNQQRQQQQ